VAVGVREGLLLAPELLSAERPSEVDCVLRDRSAATQIGAFIGGAGCVSDWWASWRDATPDVNGSDLVAAGVPPGPKIGRALAALRVALLDGLAADRDSQMAIALAAAGDDS
jgi:tRNA nucleotidyltransferase (CCA-adding enzyme)